MSKWPSTTLGKLIASGGGKIQTGPFGSQLHASDYVEDGIPCIMPANMKENRVDLSQIALISLEDAKRLSQHITQYGDIIYSRRGDVTQKALITQKEVGYFCGTGCLLLRPGLKLNSEFLTYYLSTQTIKKWIEQQAVGATMPNLNTSILSWVPCFIPLKAEQQEIADVLSVLDAKIDCNNRINAELEAMAKTLYDYWFVQFDFPDANGKPYKSSGGKMVYNQELKREIPIVFKTSNVLESFDVCYGYPFDSTQFTEDITSTPLVRIRDILDGQTSTYTREIVEEKYLLDKQDLLIGMDGNFHMNFWSGPKALLNQRCVRIRKNKEYSTLHAYFSVYPFIKAREKNVSRTTVGHLSAKDIQSLFILRAPKELQNNVTDFFEIILAKICKKKAENLQLASLRNWLLPMLMNGQVTVK